MTVTKKNSILLVGICLLLWAAYLFSFSKTFKVRKRFLELTNEQVFFSRVADNLSQLKQQNVYCDSLLASKKIVIGSSFQNNLLKIITQVSDTTDISIVAFDNPHSYTTDNAVINTYSFVVRGGFANITQLIYILEQQAKLGKVVSVGFVKKKNYRKNVYFLECTIWLQQVASL